MFKGTFFGNNLCMKSTVFLSIFIFVFCLFANDNFYFNDTLKSFNLGTYSIFYDSKIDDIESDGFIDSNGLKIYSFKDIKKVRKNWSKNAMCEQVVMQKNDIDKYIKNNDFELVRDEVFEGINIQYFLCKKLPKRKQINGVVFNIVIAKRPDNIIVGYPSIMGSL